MSTSPGSKIKLEQSEIAKATAHYPPELQQQVLWLAQYTRKHCGDLDALESKVKLFGFDKTYSYFHKILFGKYFTSDSAEGSERVDNFQVIVDALRNDSRIAELSGKVPFIKTGTFQTIQNYVDIRRTPDRVCKFGVIIGPTGAQKSASFKQMHREHPTGINHIEAAEGDNMGSVLTDVSAFYGVSMWAQTSKKRAKIAKNFNSSQTIIFDNAQMVYNPKDKKQKIFSFFRKLQDDGEGTIIFSITPADEKELFDGDHAGYFEQFEGRAGGRKRFLRLPKFTPRSDIIQIAEAFEFQDARRHAEYLEGIARSLGRVRILFESLQAGRQHAKSIGKDFTIEVLKESEELA